MAKNEQMLRLKYIEEILRRRKEKGASFEEIQRFLEKRFEDKDLLQELRFTKRTFQRDKLAMEQIFGLVISYSKKRGIYFIEQDELEISEQSVYDHLLLVEAFRQTKDRADVMLFQTRTPKGLVWMKPLVESILSKTIIRFKYHKFWSEEVSERVVKPLALKEFQHRWYLLATERHHEDETVKAFGLDRISELEPTNSHFSNGVDDIETRYENSFGIVGTLGQKPEKIHLVFNRVQGNYVKTLPLHHSQRILSESEEEIAFELRLVPTYDFERELLSYGSAVRILKPVHLKEKLRREIMDMLHNFS